MSQQKPKSTDSFPTANVNLANIEVLSSQLCYPESIALETKQFKFNIESNANFSLELNQVFISVQVKVLDDAMTKLFGSIQTAVAFNVKELESLLVEDQNGTKNIPIHLIEILNSISISTTRGIMFSRFMGTYLGNVILPIIDPKAMSVKLQ